MRFLGKSVGALMIFQGLCDAVVGSMNFVEDAEQGDWIKAAGDFISADGGVNLAIGAIAALAGSPILAAAFFIAGTIESLVGAIVRAFGKDPIDNWMRDCCFGKKWEGQRAKPSQFSVEELDKMIEGILETFYKMEAPEIEGTPHDDEMKVLFKPTGLHRGSSITIEQILITDGSNSIYPMDTPYKVPENGDERVAVKYDKEDRLESIGLSIRGTPAVKIAAELTIDLSGGDGPTYRRIANVGHVWSGKWL
jgi:hypothetical protein